MLARGRACRAARPSRAATSSSGQIRQQVQQQRRAVAHRRHGIDAAALQPAGRDHELAPRAASPAAISAMPLTGAPKCRAMCADHVDRSPACSRAGTAQARRLRAPAGRPSAPSEPSRAQLAPPSARTVTRGASAPRPSGVSNTPPPVPAGPAPARAQLAAHARQPRQPRPQQRRGLHRHRKDPARELPVNTGCPSPSAQACRPRAGPNVRQHRRQPPAARHRPRRTGSAGSSLVRFSPDLPAIRNLRPTEGLASATTTATGLRQLLGRHQPGRARPDHQRLTRSISIALSVRLAAILPHPARDKPDRITTPVRPRLTDNPSRPAARLCGRSIPPHAAPEPAPPDPKLRGGKGGPTVLLHQICHNEIHATLTETELARDYATSRRLRPHPRLAQSSFRGCRGDRQSFIPARPVRAAAGNRIGNTME